MITNEDYHVEMGKLPLSDLCKENASIFNPELTKEQLDKWTYSDYENYITSDEKKASFFTDTEKKLLAEKEITLDDATFLLKLYDTIEDIYKEDTAVLEKYLMEEYKFKELRAKSYIAKHNIMLEYGINYDNERRNNLTNQTNSKVYSNGASEYGDSRLDDYEKVLVDGYWNNNEDYFLTSTNTHVGRNNEIAAASTQALWDKIFRSQSTGIQIAFSSESLWGCWSLTKSQAHEAIDLNSSLSNFPLIAAFDEGRYGFPAEVRYLTNSSGNPDSFGTAAFYTPALSAPRYTVFYMHCLQGSYVTSGLLYDGAFIGTESYTGLSSGPHLHFSVNLGNDTHYGTYHGDNTNGQLYSDNPYTYIRLHIRPSLPAWQ